MPTGSFTTPDGVVLHHRWVGASGPVLLLVQGGLSDGDATAALAGRLAESFRVLSYDRAGLGRSTARPQPAADPLGAHAADAVALLDAVAGDDEAVVVGASIGAVIALRLALLAPPRVATVLAHEPPLPAVVGDPQREEALDEVERLAREQGPFAAGRAMGALTGGDDGREPDAPQPAPAGDVAADLAGFFRTDFHAVRASGLGVEDLLPVRERLVITGGASSRGRWEHRCAQAVADGLGLAFHELPGGHGNLVSHPRATAAALRELLATRPTGAR